MRRFTWIWLAALALALPAARGQSFPFEDPFTDYPPGSTGAPAWSILAGTFRADNGALHGPVTIRFNARPPQRYAADLTLALNGAAAEAVVAVNHQHNADLRASDMVSVRLTPAELAVSALVEQTYGAARVARTAAAPAPEGAVALKVIVDAEMGRATVFVADKPILAAVPLEYAAGLFSVRLAEGASLDRIALRAPTDEEKRTLISPTLFNDPRDVVDGGNGNLLVLHRGAPAVLTLTPDGEIIRSFGRRAPGGIPDAVALERGPRGEVMALNRFPGEVVVFERNGGIRHRFGRGLLHEPSDLTALPDGTVYVADPGAKAIAVFAPDRRFLGLVKTFGGATGTPLHLSHDTFDNLVVMLDDPAETVTLRAGIDRTKLALVSRWGESVSDVVAAEGRILAYRNGTVGEAGQPDGPAFHASAVGGLAPGGRLAYVEKTVYALDRANSRIVAVPDDLADAKPEVSYLNLSQSTALVRWTSARPAAEARVRWNDGGRPVTDYQTNKEPSRQQQVTLRGLRPGQAYSYALSPTTATIPPTDWSVEYTFHTEAAPAVPAPEKTDVPTANG